MKQIESQKIICSVNLLKLFIDKGRKIGFVAFQSSIGKVSNRSSLEHNLQKLDYLLEDSLQIETTIYKDLQTMNWQSKKASIEIFWKEKPSMEFELSDKVNFEITELITDSPKVLQFDLQTGIHFSGILTCEISIEAELNSKKRPERLGDYITPEKKMAISKSTTLFSTAQTKRKPKKQKSIILNSSDQKHSKKPNGLSRNELNSLLEEMRQSRLRIEILQDYVVELEKETAFKDMKIKELLKKIVDPLQNISRKELVDSYISSLIKSTVEGIEKVSPIRKEGKSKSKPKEEISKRERDELLDQITLLKGEVKGLRDSKFQAENQNKTLTKDILECKQKLAAITNFVFEHGNSTLLEAIISLQ